MKCVNCGAEFSGNFCSNCGTPARSTDISDEKDSDRTDQNTSRADQSIDHTDLNSSDTEQEVADEKHVSSDNRNNSTQNKTTTNPRQIPVQQMPYNTPGQIPIRQMQFNNQGQIPVQQIPHNNQGQIPLQRMPHNNQGQIPVQQMPYNNQGQIPVMKMPTTVSSVQTGKKKLAWWKIAIGVVVFLFLLGACFGSEEETSNSSYTEYSNNFGTQYSEDDDYGNEDKGYGMLGNYKVKIESAETAYYYDKYLIIVTYEFSNNGDNLASFDWSIQDSAFQDGIKLESDTIYLSSNNDKYFKNAGKDIQKGKTITVKQAYVLENTTDDVTIELKRLLSFSDESVTKRFSLM